jgi:hypothetical protein
MALGGEHGVSPAVLRRGLEPAVRSWDGAEAGLPDADARSRCTHAGSRFRTAVHAAPVARGDAEASYARMGGHAPTVARVPDDSPSVWY